MGKDQNIEINVGRGLIEEGSSIELTKWKSDGIPYSWKIKIYGTKVDEILKEVNHANDELTKKYQVVEADEKKSG